MITNENAMSTDTFSTFIKKYKNTIGIAVVVFLLGISVFLVSRLFSNDSPSPITKDQIMIQKGGNTVIVNKDGLVEYRSGDEVFYENWDTDRVLSFFSNMEARARKYIQEGNTGPCDNCYQVTLYLDGKLVTIYISEDEEFLDEVFEKFEEDNGNDGIISTYFNTPTPQNVNGNGGPTPTVFVETGGGDPLPTSAYNPQDNYPTVPAGCDAWGGQIAGGKAIISNTYCVVSQTPTP